MRWGKLDRVHDAVDTIYTAFAAAATPAMVAPYTTIVFAILKISFYFLNSSPRRLLPGK